MLVVKKENNIATVVLDRVDVHNAFNDKLIAKITEAFDSFFEDSDLRAVVIKANGKSFCAGADLNWMKAMKSYSFDENIADSLKLSEMFESITRCPVPVIGRIHGAALGGGAGLVAVCDYVFALENAKIGFTEVQLGLVPAVISPYVIQKVGSSNARAYFLSGERFDGQAAQLMGLVHKIFKTEKEMDNEIEKILGLILSSGPRASRVCKKLIWDNINYKSDWENLRSRTAHTIANQRVSKEGQEGMNALLEKRKAEWVK